MPAWRERHDSLAAAGMVAAGPAMSALLRALRQRDAGQLDGLTLVATSTLLVLLGPPKRLPWVDGAGYCAPAPGVPGLWLPTRLAPDMPDELLHAALQRRSGHAAVLLWNAPELVLGLDDALPVRPEVLDWLEGALA